MNQKQNQLLGGIVLIAMGAAAMLNLSGVNIFGLSPWLVWGLGMPVLGGLMVAYQRLQENGGRVDGRFLRENLWLLFPLIIAAFFIFNINWAYLSAVIFIGVGLMLLAQPREKQA